MRKKEQRAKFIEFRECLSVYGNSAFSRLSHIQMQFIAPLAIAKRRWSTFTRQALSRERRPALERALCYGF